MDIWTLVVNSSLLLCVGIAFVYGVSRFFKSNVALFNQLVVCGLGCMMLGRLFNVVALLTSGSITSEFTVGKLGFVGGFLFLFSASYGQMDGLVDGGEEEFRKYRIISLSAPLLMAAAYMLVFFSDSANEDKIVTAVGVAAFAQCACFNLKHLIIPDVDDGIIQSIRGYNLVALILAALSAAELISGNFGNKTFDIIITVLICVTYLAVIPILEKGTKKWTI